MFLTKMGMVGSDSTDEAREAAEETEETEETEEMLLERCIVVVRLVAGVVGCRV